MWITKCHQRKKAKQRTTIFFLQFNVGSEKTSIFNIFSIQVNVTETWQSSFFFCYMCKKKYFKNTEKPLCHIWPESLFVWPAGRESHTPLRPLPSLQRRKSERDSHARAHDTQERRWELPREGGAESRTLLNPSPSPLPPSCLAPEGRRDEYKTGCVVVVGAAEQSKSLPETCGGSS